MNFHKNNVWIKEEIFVYGMIMSYTTTTLHAPYKAEKSQSNYHNLVQGVG